MNAIAPPQPTPNLRKRRIAIAITVFYLKCAPIQFCYPLIAPLIAMQQLQTLPMSDRQILQFGQEGNLIIELQAITPFLKQF